MSNIRVRTSLAALAIVTALATIAGIAMSTQRPAAAQQTSIQPEIRQSGAWSLDEQMLDVARQNPDFGGMYFDREGRLTMHVLKSGLAAADGFGRLAGMSLDVESAFHDHPNMEWLRQNGSASFLRITASRISMRGTRLQRETCWQFQEWC